MFNQNDRLIGRTVQMDELEKIYASRSLELVTVSGPSGCGKTALIREFCRNKRAVLFTASRTNGAINLSAFSKAISKAMYKGLRSLVRFSSMSEAFLFLKRMSEKDRLIIVIDSYDRLMDSDDTAASTIREIIQHDLGNANMMIVLAGPERTMSEQRFGLEPRRIILGNLSFSEVRSAFGNSFSADDIMKIYAATGGCPEYLRHFDSRRSLKDNMDAAFLRPDSPLLNGPMDRFASMVRNTEQYECILSALSNGPMQMKEIVEASGVSPSSACSTYLSALIDLGVVEKRLPYGESSTRKGVYRICDHALMFWFRFIHENMSLIEYRYGDDLYDLTIGKDDSYPVPVFREVCLQAIAENPAYFDLHMSRSGEWWGDAGSIDIVAADLLTTMFCDCRYRDSPVGMSVLDALVSKSASVRTIGARRYALFSKAGFTDELQAYAEKHPDVVLVSFEDICRF